MTRMVTDRQTRIGLELETALAAAIDRPFRSLPRPDVGFSCSADSLWLKLNSQERYR
jgi:hypothetical protein